MESERMSSSYAIKQASLTASEKDATPLQPDALLSAQYFDDRRRKKLREPERRLMFAVLKDAVECFQVNHSARCGKRKRLFDDAQEWIFAVSDWVFGFESVCSALGLDPEYVRDGLVRWTEKQSPKRRSASLWEGTNVFLAGPAAQP